jgi:hypothetical protein
LGLGDQPAAADPAMTVFQNGRPIFVLHGYSAEQARDIVNALLSDTAGVTFAAAREGAAQ